MSILADLPKRTRVLALLGLVGMVGAGGVLGFGPFVRARVAGAARARGLSADVARVQPGLGAIWLKDIDLRVPRMPGVSVHIDALRVAVGWHFNVTELTVHGGLVELRGDTEELRRELAAYRADQRQEADAKTASSVRYMADGVELIWRERSTQSAQHAWGLHYERDSARERVAVDLLRFDDEGLGVEARRPQAVLRHVGDTLTDGGSRRQLESLQAEAVELNVHIQAEPASAAATGDKREASRFQPDPLRGVRLRAALNALSTVAARSLPEAAQLDLQGVGVRFRRGSDELNFGPSVLRVTRLGSQIVASLVPSAEASGMPLELKVSLPVGAGEVRAQVRGGPVSLRSLGIREGDFGLSAVQTATLAASGDMTLAADGSTLAFAGSGLADHVSLKRPELSSSPLSGIHAGFQVRGSTALDGSRLSIEDGELSLGNVHVQGAGTLTRGERTLRMHWSGGVPLASCQALLDATPHGLAPLVAGMRLSGTFAVNSSLDYDSEQPGQTRVRLNVANDCRVEQVPPELSPRRFEALWQREVKGADKLPMEVESGPGSPDWVPYEAISPFMEAAVLVCEDGGFERHHGFDFEAIENSIKDNLIKGRFVRGGSTISMQLAKNLYLGKEKTLGRKLQEALLTMLLEQELSKQELMELYLNVIEYGPGIYGIGPAAHYYFAKRASDLSLAQALYIATILPNPERQHFDPDGKVSPSWTRYLQHLMRIAKKIGKISDEQLQAGLAEQVAFHVADSGGALPAASSTPEEGTDTPTELSR